MPESDIRPEAVEAEIAALSKQIEEKRRLLESEKGIVEERGNEKHLIRAALAEHASVSAPKSPSSSANPVSPPASYLDELDEADAKKVTDLVSFAFSHGIARAIAKAQDESPRLADAFHDVLVDRLYDEMKARRWVS